MLFCLFIFDDFCGYGPFKLDILFCRTPCRTFFDISNEKGGEVKCIKIFVIPVINNKLVLVVSSRINSTGLLTVLMALILLPMTMSYMFHK